jgi:hypothetical protein
LVSAVAAALVLGVATPAPAGTLDQQQSAGGASSAIVSTQSLAQSFTAGISGNLDQADLFLTAFGTPSAAMNVEIRNVSAGSPGTSVLASASVPASSVSGSPGGFVSFHFATPAPVTAGSQYALVAWSAAVFPDDDAWSRGAGTNPYTGGNLFQNGTSPPSGPWSSQPTSDFAFKTYVAPPTPPATSVPKKKCKKHKKHRAASAKKKHCKKKKH